MDIPNPPEENTLLENITGFLIHFFFFFLVHFFNIHMSIV